MGKRLLLPSGYIRLNLGLMGSVERHKARLVIRGFKQVKDKDYKHTFSPVAKLTAV